MNKNRLIPALILIALAAFGGKIFAQKTVSNFQQLNAAKTERIFSKSAKPENPSASPLKAFSEAAAAKTFPAQTAALYQRPNADERLKKYLRRAFGPYALLGDVASAGAAQIIDSPKEWENTATGFARRVGSAFGRKAITETVAYGLDETLKLDSGFYKSGKKKFGERIENAFLSTFTARKPDGKRVIGVPRLVGAYASGIVAAEVWYPNNYGFKDGLRLGTYSLGADFGVNILREFFLK